jgi:penicillin-binding protein 1A
MPYQIIRQIDDNQGHKLQEYTPQGKSVFPAESVLQLVDILQDVVNKGTGTLARLPKIAVAGKTGTADKARDIWFVGFTPDTVTAVWGGNDNYSEVRGNVTGGTVMAKIWHDYMVDFYKTHEPPAVAFDPPAVPFAKKITRINPSVLKQIEDTEAGLNPDEKQTPTGEQQISGETDPNTGTATDQSTDQKIPDAPPPLDDQGHAALPDTQPHTESPQQTDARKEEPPVKAPEIQQEPPKAPEIHQPLPEPAPSIPKGEAPPPAPIGTN